MFAPDTMTIAFSDPIEPPIETNIDNDTIIDISFSSIATTFLSPNDKEPVTMAQKITVTMTDDIDGDVASETVNFGIDGVNYEIDLNEQNALAIREALATYIYNGRRVSGRKISGTSTATTPSSGANKERLQNIRSWAKENGHEVSERGRIKSELMDAYDKANA